MLSVLGEVLPLAVCVAVSPIPVIAFLMSPARWTAPLQSLRVWLTHNNATVMAVLLLVIGSVVIGKGLGYL